MRSFAVLSGLAAFAVAQTFPIDTVSGIAVPALQGPTLGQGASSESKPYNSDSVYQSNYNAAVASGSKTGGTSRRRNLFNKRTGDAPCSAQPLGAGPAVTPDTPDAFLAFPAFSTAATGATTPSGYVNTFTDLHASSSVPMGYLGYDSYTTYDVAACAARCDSLSGCFAFNMFFERSPSLNPDVNCPNPASTTVIKCAYWATTIDATTATNQGSTRNDFKIVIAGSNGYVSQKVDVPGYDDAYLGGAAINAPAECNSHIGSEVWSGDAFDPSRCAAWCEGTSQFNIEHLGGRSICRFFNTYIWLKDGVPVGQVCAMYTRSWDISYATNVGQYDNEGHHYTVSQSFTFSNTTDPGADICDATCMSQKPCPVSSSSSTTVASSTTAPASSSTTTSVYVSTTSSTLSTTAVSTTPSASPTTSAVSTSSSASSTSPAASTSSSVSPTTTAISSTTGKSSSTTASTTSCTTTTGSAKSSTTTGKTSTTSCTTTTSSAKTSSTSCTTTTSSAKSSTTTSCTTTTAKTTTPSTTSTKCTTTTLQTSTTKAATTTSASPTPTNTGKCFKLKISSSYVSVSSSGKLTYSASGSATVFGINKWSLLTVASTCKPIMRTLENWFNPFYGYMSTQALSPLICSKNSDNTLKVIGLISENKVWTSSKDSGIIHGNCPGKDWVEASLIVESADCPAGYRDDIRG